MSGIYIHIPFCKQACHYCDFHFSTNMRLKDDMLKAISKEISLQKGYFGEDSIISSIYFGGGTPSILSSSEIKSILTQIKQDFNVAADSEITIEANPDDITENKLKELFLAGVNRLSVGIQSFNPKLLKWMNRAHNKEEALNAMALIAQSDFDNYTVDLIYGNPGQSLKSLEEDIKTLLRFKPPHISAYCLTIEEKTVFGRLLKRGELNEVKEESAASHFIMVNKLLSANGYEQYEISNYCLAGKSSFHNTNYWKGVPYLGIGPGAHSFKNNERQYNIANNAKYIHALAKNEIPAEKELLSKHDAINEYIMTALRTSIGVSFKKLLIDYHFDLRTAYPTLINSWQQQGLAEVSVDDHLQLTLQGKLIADKLASDLFLID